MKMKLSFSDNNSSLLKILYNHLLENGKKTVRLKIAAIIIFVITMILYSKIKQKICYESFELLDGRKCSFENLLKKINSNRMSNI